MRYRLETSDASSLVLHKLRSGRKMSDVADDFFAASLRCFLPRFGTFHGT
jgi:hypothetical protein